MKLSTPSLAPPTELRTRLCEGIELTGEVKFTEVMRVETKISGKVVSDSGSLVVSEKGYVQAVIEAGFVEVFGVVEGTITAKYKVDIRTDGRVRGDIDAAILHLGHE